MVAGFEDSSSGSILLYGKAIDARGTRRSIPMRCPADNAGHR
jgi:ABC-type Fe3+/spermidine/putrescine transport system ATPase subunit